MKIFRAYKTELDLNNRQRTLLKKHAGAARWAYNWGLGRKIESYKATGKSPSAIDLHTQVQADKFRMTDDVSFNGYEKTFKAAP